MTSPFEKVRQQFALFLEAEEFFESVKLSQVVSEDPFLGLVVTLDDEVHALGCDKDNYYGLGQVSAIPKLTRIEPLCGLGIKQFAAGMSHILALAKNGTVFAWGGNGYCQLGDGSTDNISTPIVVAGVLADKVVQKISCGQYYSTALTDDGKLYSWGHNQYGQTGQPTTSVNTRTPMLVETLAKEHKVTYVANNLNTTICLTDAGFVFMFGQDECGFLGGNINFTSTPYKVKITGVVEKIRCGQVHTLALTNIGFLYVWGCNTYGQLGMAGIPSGGKVMPPKRLNFGDKDFSYQLIDIEISSRFTSHATDTEGNKYIWGALESGAKALQPQEYAGRIYDYRGDLALNQDSISRIENVLLAAFNDKETSDFIIAIEEKDIYVHKTILVIRSEYFKAMFNSDWKEAKSNRVTISNSTYDVYCLFLKYIYSGKLEKVDAENGMGLLQLAHLTMDDVLIQLCVERIPKLVRFDNVATIYCLAASMDQTVLSDFCVRYAMRNMAAVIMSDAFNEAPGDHVKKLLKEAVIRDLFSTCVS